MEATSNVIHRPRIAPGLCLGALGILGFSFTLPATRLAVADLDPTVVGLGRAAMAGLLAALVLLGSRTAFPPRCYWSRLGLVSVGVVLGFPLFTTLALHRLTAAHGAVITGMLPAATAVLAVLLGGERPGPAFWLVCLGGLAAVIAFAASQGAGRPQGADLLALTAVAFGALGYAEGAVLARDLGGWRVICCALVVALPVVVPISVYAVARTGLSAGPEAWAGFAYLSVVSMFFAFFAWYKGLAVGGLARVSQVQLAQPVLTVLWSYLLLGEHIGRATVLAGAAVLVCAAASQRTRVRPGAPLRTSEGISDPPAMNRFPPGPARLIPATPPALVPPGPTDLQP